MNLPNDQHVTYHEFEKMKKETDQLLELIDGAVFMVPSPSTQHQRISMKLSGMLYHLLNNHECEVLAAPYDIELVDLMTDEKRIVIPDLSIICDKKGFTEQKYAGSPEIIIEIISPSNQSHDLITKTNLYQNNKVKEYWIVNPILNNIMIYFLGDDEKYRLVENEKQGIVKSRVLEGFEVDVAGVFD